MTDIDHNHSDYGDCNDATTMRDFNFPGRKIVMVIVIVGIICMLINRFGAGMGPLTWIGALLIIGSIIYMLCWAIRYHNKRMVTRLAASLLLISVLYAFIGYLSCQISGNPTSEQSAPAAPQSVEAAQSSVFSDPISIAMLISIVGLLMVILITIYYRFVRHDREALDKWLSRSRWIRMLLILIPILVIAFAWLL